MCHACHRLWKCYKTLPFCSLLTRCTTPCACHAKRHLNVQRCSEHRDFFENKHFDLEMRFAPQRGALFRHLNFQKRSKAEVFRTFWLRHVLRAATACIFFDIATSKSAPKLRCFVHFDFGLLWHCPTSNQDNALYSVCGSMRWRMASACVFAGLPWRFLSSGLQHLCTQTFDCTAMASGCKVVSHALIRQSTCRHNAQILDSDGGWQVSSRVCGRALRLRGSGSCGYPKACFKSPTPAITKPSRFAHFWEGAQSLAPATQNDIWTSKSGPNPWCF